MRKSPLKRVVSIALTVLLMLSATPALAAPFAGLPAAPAPVELDAADFAAIWASMHEAPGQPGPQALASALSTGGPNVPTGLDGVAGSGLITLWWDSDPAAAGFKVYRKKSTESTFTQVSMEPEPYYEDDTVTNGIGFDYCVSAVSSIGAETAKSGSITLTPTAAPVFRISGDDRYETCVEISRTNWGSSSKAVLVAGAGYADALSASSLCGLYSAPLLLTEPDAVPAAVMSELGRLGVTEVFIVGGAGVVSADVVTQLGGAGIDATRIGGSNRYHTSELVARHVVNNGGDPDAVFLCRADDYADALSIAPFAYRYKTPVLLIGFEQIPYETFRAMNDLARKFVVVVGGETVIPTEVVPVLWWPNYPPADAMWVRLWGQDRYYTSVAVVQAFQVLEYPMLGVATGMHFPDALGGGVACGAGQGALLLASPTDLNLGARTLVSRYKGHLTEIQVFGGDGALGEKILDRLEAAAD